MRPMTSRLLPVGAALAGGLFLLGGWGAAETRAQAPTAPANVAAVAGTWTIDPSHSNISFAVRHLGLSTCRGRFDDYAGTIRIDAENPEKSSVQVTIKAASIDTDIAQRDEHLRGPDFFDVAKYPEMTFRSKRIEKGREDVYLAHGTLTMRGVSREIVLPFVAAGPVPDQRAGRRIGFDADVRLNRQDYGLKFHQVLDNGALAIANNVDVSISVEATPEKKAAP
jgi:polyisoprenoid-binding protein YceI